MARTLLSELQPDPDVLSQVLAEDLHLPIDGPAHELRRWLPKALFNIAHTWLNQLEEREGHSVEPIPAPPPAPRRSRQSGRASSTERLAVPAPARGDRASSAPADSLHGPLLDLSPLALPPRSFPPIGEVVAGSSTARLQQPSTSLARQQSRDRAERARAWARARAERFEAEEQQEEQQQVEMDGSSPAAQLEQQDTQDYHEEQYDERNQRRPLTAFHPTSALQAHLTPPTLANTSPVSRSRSACTVKVPDRTDSAEDQPFSAALEHFSRPSRSGPAQQLDDGEDGYVLPFQLPVKARSTSAAPFVALADRTPAAPTSTSTSRRLPFADRSSAHNSRAASPAPKPAQTVKLNPFLPSGATLPSIQFHPATSSPQPGATGPLKSSLLASSAAFAGPSRGVSSPLSSVPASGMRSSSPLSSLSSSPPPSSGVEMEEVARKLAAPKSTRTYGKVKGKGKRRASSARDEQEEQEQEEARPKRRKSAPTRYSPSNAPRPTYLPQPSSAHATSPSSSSDGPAAEAASRPKRRKSEPARYGAWTGWKDMRIKGLQLVGGTAGSEVVRAKTAGEGGGGGGLGRSAGGREGEGKRRRERSPSLVPDSADDEQALASPASSPSSKKPLPPPPRSYGAFTRDPYYNGDDDDSGETIVVVAAEPPGGGR